MSTINQDNLSLSNLSQQRERLSTESDLSQTPLQALIDDATGGGDQHNGAGIPAADSLRNPANFASPGPMTSLLSEPLLSNPFASVQVSGTQSASVNVEKQTQPTTYSMKSGDTLNGVAAANDMSLNELIALNPQIRNLDMIHPGDRIIVSSERGTEA